MVQLGVIHGRFQVLHNDHMQYLLAGKAHCRHLVVGITNPDPLLSRADPADPTRSKRSSNPLTYFERYTLVTAAFRESGIPETTFSVVPFPINIPELYEYYVPMDAVFFVTIYDQWGERKYELLRSKGLQVDVMWRKTPDQKGLTGAKVRSLMVSGGNWEELVPRSTARLLKEWRISDRLTRLPDLVQDEARRGT